MRVVFFDIETTGLSVVSDFSLAVDRDLDGDEQVFEHLAPLDSYLGNMVEDGYSLCGHNIVGFDLPFICSRMLRGRGRSTLLNALLRRASVPILDTVVMSRLMKDTPEKFGARSHSMDSWVIKLMNQGNRNVEPKVEIEDWQEADRSALMSRCSVDVKNQVEIWRYMANYFGEWFEDHPVYSRIQAFLRFMVEHLSRGMPVFEDKKDKALADVKGEIRRIEQELFEKYGAHKSTWASNKKIDELFKAHYNKPLPLGELTPKTQRRNPLFSKKIKAKLIAEFPGCEKIFDWKDAKNQLSFLDPRLKKSLFHPDSYLDGVCYPMSGIANQRLLRSSYSNPPANQFSKEVKRLIGKEGYTVVGADIQGLELNILAQLLERYTGESSLKEELVSGENPKAKTVKIFTEVGDLFRNIPEEDREKTAKMLLYAFLYSAGKRTLLQNLQLPATEENKTLLGRAFERRVPGIGELKSILSEHFSPPYGGYPYGVFENYYNLSCECKEMAVLNTECQSSGAVFCMMLLGAYYENARETIDGVVPLFVNHDELSFAAPLGEGIFEKAVAAARKAEAEFPNYGIGPLWSTLSVSELASNLGDSH